MTDTNERDAYIAGLRAFADILDADPTLPIPDNRDIAWYLFGSADKLTAAEQKRRAAELVRALPGPAKKWDTDFLFRYGGSVEGLQWEVIVDRAAVCKRIVVGKKTKQIVDPSAPLVETEVDDVVWECEPLLAESEGV